MILISTKATKNIEKFYRSFAKRHQYDYSIQMMQENIQQVFNAVTSIDYSRSRIPMLPKYRNFGYKETSFKRNGKGNKVDWYIEFMENGENIYIMEVLHKSQMYENKQCFSIITESQLCTMIKESIKKVFSIS